MSAEEHQFGADFELCWRSLADNAISLDSPVGVEICRKAIGRARTKSHIPEESMEWWISFDKCSYRHQFARAKYVKEGSAERLKIELPLQVVPACLVFARNFDGLFGGTRFSRTYALEWDSGDRDCLRKPSISRFSMRKLGVDETYKPKPKPKPKPGPAPGAPGHGAAGAHGPAGAGGAGGGAGGGGGPDAAGPAGGPAGGLAVEALPLADGMPESLENILGQDMEVDNESGHISADFFKNAAARRAAKAAEAGDAGEGPAAPAPPTPGEAATEKADEQYKQHCKKRNRSWQLQ